MGFEQMIEQMKKEFEEKYENSDIDKQLDTLQELWLLTSILG